MVAATKFGFSARLIYYKGLGTLGAAAGQLALRKINNSSFGGGRIIWRAIRIVLDAASGDKVFCVIPALGKSSNGLQTNGKSVL